MNDFKNFLKVFATGAMLYLLIAGVPRYFRNNPEFANFYTAISSDRAIELGMIKGYSLDIKYGWNIGMAQNTEELISSLGGQFTEPSGEEIIEISSTSANDSIAGTGAQKIEVKCVRQDFTEETYEIDMNGLTAVTTPVPCLYINRMIVSQAGSGKTNAGDIIASQSVSGIDLRQIPAEISVTQSCLYVVPKGYTALIEKVEFSVLRRQSGDPKVQFRGYVLNNGRLVMFKPLKIDADTNSTSGPMASEIPPYTTKRNEGDVFFFTAESNTSNTDVTCRAQVLLVENKYLDLTTNEY